MDWQEQEDTTTYKVVVNHEEQYSIWPADRENPLGWKDVGKVGPKQECLDYIKEVWTDMRPLSLRKKMEEMAKQKSEVKEEPAPAESSQAEQGMDELVMRLSEGDHPVVASAVGDSVAELKKSVERGYVHIKFTETRGGTELGVRLNEKLCDLSKGDFEKATGTIHLVGGLTLNYVKVNCIADINLKNLQGKGHLEPINDKSK